MRTRRSFTAVVAVSALAASFLLGACGGGDGDGDQEDEGEGGLVASCSDIPTPAPKQTGAAALFNLDGIADVLTSGEGTGADDGYIVITAVSAGTIPDLQSKFRDMVEAAGFDISGTDDEGDEAEVFFSHGDKAAGQVRMHTSDCAGKVDVKISLLDNPEVMPTS